ncbi:hypothetical protein EUGRSUZ_K01587 [Eucalyptus grandis]|uniref:Uncharacterized protein n=2 Tax=Eucalyptus grandis TaxID=71139 RepID=A0ACC3IVL7_EUCGR|nr:hypothetical protein EUGRSUZ_K01587 [Eucalyptus grandis]
MTIQSHNHIFSLFLINELQRSDLQLHHTAEVLEAHEPVPVSIHLRYHAPALPQRAPPVPHRLERPQQLLRRDPPVAVPVEELERPPHLDVAARVRLLVPARRADPAHQVLDPHPGGPALVGAPDLPQHQRLLVGAQRLGPEPAQQGLEVLPREDPVVVAVDVREGPDELAVHLGRRRHVGPLPRELRGEHAGGRPRLSALVHRRRGRGAGRRRRRRRPVRPVRPVLLGPEEAFGAEPVDLDDELHGGRRERNR